MLITGRVLYQIEDWINPFESFWEAVRNSHLNEAFDDVRAVGRKFLSLLLTIDPDH
jgi:hypothetical protein